MFEHKSQLLSFAERRYNFNINFIVNEPSKFLIR